MSAKFGAWQDPLRFHLTRYRSEEWGRVQEAEQAGCEDTEFELQGRLAYFSQSKKGAIRGLQSPANQGPVLPNLHPETLRTQITQTFVHR